MEWIEKHAKNHWLSTQEKADVKRCGKCENCKRVEDCKTLALRAFSQADIKRARGEHGYTVGEDVRLIWNQALKDYPCTGEPNNTGENRRGK